MTTEQKVQRAAHKVALALEDVQQAAFVKREADEELVNAMRKARVAGLSLRAIAEAAGLSPEWVRQRTSS